MARQTTPQPNVGPALPGALGHTVTLMLVGAGVGFLVRFAYYAVLRSTVSATMQVLAAAAAVVGFGYLGSKLTGARGWWYAAVAIGVLTLAGVLFFAMA